MPYEYEIIQEIIDTPANIYESEIILNRIYQKYRYKPKIDFGGSSTECYKL